MSALGGAAARFRTHVRALWPRSVLAPVLPFVLFALYQGLFRHELRVEHVLMILVAAVLAYTGPRTKELLLGLYPLALVAVFYDAMRPIQKIGLTPSRVHLCDLRSLELALFGVNVGGQRMTPHDWFYVHHRPALDLFCSVPYATFLAACVACCIYLYIHDRQAMRRFSWGFLVLNVLAFFTYHLVPAGPPWYFHAHGCTVDLATPATEGPALMRVDEMLGISFFHGMYARASSVFGALPSLHCAYPILILIEGWRTFGWKLRVAAMGFACWMIFSAVYLDHHWILDAMLGVFYAVLTTFSLRLVFGSSRKLESDLRVTESVTADIVDILEPASGAPVSSSSSSSGGGE